MKSHLIITGDSGSGKSFIANAIVEKFHPLERLEFSKHHFSNSENSPNITSVSNGLTRIILLDGLKDSNSLDEILLIISNGITTSIGTIYPKLIIVLSDDFNTNLLKQSFLRRFSIINTNSDTLKDAMLKVHDFLHPHP